MDSDFLIMAGPCAVESREQVLEVAKGVKELGATHLRGGAFKPRTSPNSFQGLGEEGLKYLNEAKKLTGLKIVTELMDMDQYDLFEKYDVDVIQIGSRNMQNFELLKKLAMKGSEKVVLIKRGISATKKEVLGAIEYLEKYGHKGEIMFCERGIRTFANGEYDRFTLDIGFIADLKKDSSFKYRVIVDPSHAAGRKDMVSDLTYAGVVAGADGVIIEVKPTEDYAPKCDADQAITLSNLKEILLRSKNFYKELH